MTFLEFFNIDKKTNSIDTGSLSPDKRTHRHEKGMYAVNQATGKTKKINGVARYLTTKNDEINQCIRTGKDVPLSLAKAEQLKKQYGLNPTAEEPEKAIKQTKVYLSMNPNGSYKLTFKGDVYGKGKVFR